MALAEELHGASGWALETSLQEPGNCRLYEKTGYRRTGKAEPVNERMALENARRRLGEPALMAILAPSMFNPTPERT